MKHRLREENRRSPARRCASSGIICLILAIVSVALATTGCGGPKVQIYTHPDADMAFYTKVGVIPFASLSGDRFAGEKFSIEFTTALLSAQMFEVVDYGVFVNDVASLIGSRSPADGLSKEELKKIADATGVQGVFYGTVIQYEMISSSSGAFPVISVEARLIDAETATVVWQSTITERGGPKTPIIGVGETRTLGELAQQLSEKLVSKIQ